MTIPERAAINKMFDDIEKNPNEINTKSFIKLLS